MSNTGSERDATRLGSDIASEEPHSEAATLATCGYQSASGQPPSTVTHPHLCEIFSDGLFSSSNTFNRPGKVETVA
jgi:hypothetical protein